MFFLLRISFWIVILLALLPTGGSQPSADDAKFGATDAVVAASAAMSDIGKFCDRQPEACKVGAHATAAIGQRAQAGAKMVYEFISERVARGEPDRDASATTGSVLQTTVPELSGSQSTLTQADMEPAWRGPPARTEKVPLPRPDPRRKV